MTEKQFPQGMEQIFVEYYLRRQFEALFPRGVTQKLEAGPPAELAYLLTLEDDLGRDRALHEKLGAVFGAAVGMTSVIDAPSRSRRTSFTITGQIPEIAAAIISGDREGARAAAAEMDLRLLLDMTPRLEKIFAALAQNSAMAEMPEPELGRPLVVGHALKFPRK
jgi:hypothetical protein